jgi:ferredoxin
MKALGGGHLIGDADAAFKYAMEVYGVSSIAVGMKSSAEIDLNVSIFSGITPDESLKEKVSTDKRRLHIHDWCIGCGSCITACDKGALLLEDGRAKVDDSKCVLCGYCAAKCKDFCIKVI